MSEPTFTVEVDVHKSVIEVGEDANGPKYLKVFTILKGRYIVWKIHGKYRWARNFRGKPEFRLGIAGHGAADTLLGAVEASLRNFAEREEARIAAGAEPREKAVEGVRLPQPEAGPDPAKAPRPAPPLRIAYCRECRWEGALPPARLCPACRSPRVSEGTRPGEDDA